MSFDIDEMLYIYGFAGSEINLCMNCLCSEWKWTICDAIDC
jgi:hypothetical protein